MYSVSIPLKPDGTGAPIQGAIINGDGGHRTDARGCPTRSEDSARSNELVIEIVRPSTCLAL